MSNVIKVLSELKALLEGAHSKIDMLIDMYGGEKSVKDEVMFCPIHGEIMQRRENERGHWFSHRLDDGTWCKGIPQRRNP